MTIAFRGICESNYERTNRDGCFLGNEKSCEERIAHTTTKKGHSVMLMNCTPLGG